MYVTLSWLFGPWIFLKLSTTYTCTKAFFAFLLTFTLPDFRRSQNYSMKSHSFTVYPASEASSARVFLFSSFFFPFLASSCIFRCILGDHWGLLPLLPIISGNEPFLVSTINRKKKQNYKDNKDIILPVSIRKRQPLLPTPSQKVDFAPCIPLPHFP